jgi:hypothetical protein
MLPRLTHYCTNTHVRSFVVASVFLSFVLHLDLITLVIPQWIYVFDLAAKEATRYTYVIL